MKLEITKEQYKLILEILDFRIQGTNEVTIGLDGAELYLNTPENVDDKVYFEVIES